MTSLENHELNQKVALLTKFTTLLGICDGNFSYNVSSSGIIEYAQLFYKSVNIQFRSQNYPANYLPDASCTNQFDSSSNGITFEFESFETQAQYDFIAFRDLDGNEFGGYHFRDDGCSGDLSVRTNLLLLKIEQYILRELEYLSIAHVCLFQFISSLTTQ